jgi:hypothetical protein
VRSGDEHAVKLWLRIGVTDDRDEAEQQGNAHRSRIMVLPAVAR